MANTLPDNPFGLTADQLQQLLIPGTPALPELEDARHNLEALRWAPQTHVMLAQTQSHMEGIERFPQTAYTHYRLFIRSGDRADY